MIEPLPQVENKKKMNCFMNYNKSLSGPNFKKGTLFIGYLNAVISIVFIIVSSTSLAFESNLFNVYEDNNHYGQGYGWGDTYVKKFYAVVDFIGPPIILTIGLVCFGFTIALIIGTHMQKPQMMRVYLSFGAISLMLSIGVMSFIVVIMAFLGQLRSMIFAMQTFFFFGVYMVELHVIRRTIDLFETPSDIQEALVTDEKDTSLPPYERCEHIPRLTVVT